MSIEQCAISEFCLHSFVWLDVAYISDAKISVIVENFPLDGASEVTTVWRYTNMLIIIIIIIIMIGGGFESFFAMQKVHNLTIFMPFRREHKALYIMFKANKT